MKTVNIRELCYEFKEFEKALTPYELAECKKIATAWQMSVEDLKLSMGWCAIGPSYHIVNPKTGEKIDITDYDSW